MKYIKLFFISVFAVTLLQAKSPSQLVEQMYQTSDPALKAKLMNEVKRKLAKLNQEEREKTLLGLRSQAEENYKNSSENQPDNQNDSNIHDGDNGDNSGDGGNGGGEGGDGGNGD